jgi:hypothetical protein
MLRSKFDLKIYDSNIVIEYQIMKKVIQSIPMARGVSLIYRASRDGF